MFDSAQDCNPTNFNAKLINYHETHSNHPGTKQPWGITQVNEEMHKNQKYKIQQNLGQISELHLRAL